MTKMTPMKRPLVLALSLTAALALASCGGTTSPAAVPTSPPSTHGHATTDPAHSEPSTSPSNSASKRIDVTVKGKQVTPAPATVNIGVGESLTIAVTSDKANVLHAHGFEVERALKAGQPEEVTITGAQTGSFEFELHDPELHLFDVAVR